MADLGSSRNHRDPAYEASRISMQVGYSSARNGPEFRAGCSLPMVWPGVLAAYNRRIGSEVLLHRTPPAVLDRGASLDDQGDRGGPTLDRLLEGVSRERARCLRGVPLLKRDPQRITLFRQS